MLFRLLNIVSLILCLVGTTKLSGQTTPQDPFAYRGHLYGLENVSLRSWAIREDGRYLAYSTGSSSFTILDLLDGVTKSAVPPPTTGNVMALFFESKTRLYAVTKSGIEYFNLTKPYNVEIEDTKFEVVDQNRGTPVDACVDAAKNTYYLETSEELDRQVIRVVANKEQVRKILWNTIFPSRSADHTPVGLRCLGSSVLVISSFSDDGRERVNLANVLPAGTVQARVDLADLYIDYDVLDLHPSAAKDRILIMLSLRSASGSDVDDTGYTSLPLSLTASEVVDLGSDPRNLAVFLEGTIPWVGFFMGKDLLEDRNNPPLDQFLSLPQAQVIGRPDFDERGVGTTRAGGFSSRSFFTSSWLFTDKDTYAYGIMESGGVSLISRAPNLELVQAPSVTAVSQSDTLTFRIKTELQSRYEIYCENNRDLEGTLSGLSETPPGRLVKTGFLLANTPETLSIPVNTLGVTKVGDYSLVIRSKDLDKPEVSTRFPWARMGVAFQFSPDPQPVKDFRLGYGDESVTVYFQPIDLEANISHYYVYFSTNPSDLETLPTSEAELATSAFATLKERIPRMDTGYFQSPIKLTASSWGGSYRLGPIRNDRTIYFRVQAVSTGAKFSGDNPDALGQAPQSTKSLSQAFGSNMSCAVESVPFSFSAILLLMSCFLLLWRLKKKASVIN